MLDLKRHPFAVQAHFDFSLVVTFAFEKEVLQPLIPEHFELDLFQERYAFLAVALVKTNRLRPHGFPEIIGKDFTLAGYRIFVTYRNQEGVKRRGLYILKSQTDKVFMAVSGNLFTHYRYEKSQFEIEAAEQNIAIKNDLGLRIQATRKNPEQVLNQSIFDDFKTARRYAGPMPYTFTYDEKRKRIITVKGNRNQWQPEPINVTDYEIPYLNQFAEQPILANAFITENINYEWTKGAIDTI